MNADSPGSHHKLDPDSTNTVAASMFANSISFRESYTLTGSDNTLSAGNNLNPDTGATCTISSILAGTTVGLNGINSTNVAVTTGTIVLGGVNI